MIHKKCHIANLTLGSSFTKQDNHDDKRDKSHTSFICFRNVVFQNVRCINMHATKNNENK